MLKDRLKCLQPLTLESLMKNSTLARNGLSQQFVDLIARLVDMVSWLIKRSGMGDVTQSLLDGWPRIAKDVLGWSRATVKLGMHEFSSKIK